MLISIAMILMALSCICILLGHEKKLISYEIRMFIWIIGCLFIPISLCIYCIGIIK